MKTFFFGVKSPQEAGHFLYVADARYRASYVSEESLPFKVHILDGGIIPERGAQPQGKCYLAHIGGWTILSMWDRTGDQRGNSNANFLFEGDFTLEEAKGLVAQHHPSLWKRIQQL